MDGRHLLIAMVAAAALVALHELWLHRCEWLGLHDRGRRYRVRLGKGEWSEWRERCPRCGHVERLP